MSDEYDYKYDSLEDPHVYPGTRILRNKFGIKPILKRKSVCFFVSVAICLGHFVP